MQCLCTFSTEGSRSSSLSRQLGAVGVKHCCLDSHRRQGSAWSPGTSYITHGDMHTHAHLAGSSLSHHSFIRRGAISGVERNRTLHGAIIGDADTKITVSQRVCSILICLTLQMHCYFILIMMNACLVPLGICLRAAGVLRRIVGRWRDGWNELLKVHNVGQEGILGSGAFWVNRTRAMWSQLGGNSGRHIKIT